MFRNFILKGVADGPYPLLCLTCVHLGFQRLLHLCRHRRQQVIAGGPLEASNVCGSFPTGDEVLNGRGGGVAHAGVVFVFKGKIGVRSALYKIFAIFELLRHSFGASSRTHSVCSSWEAYCEFSLVNFLILKPLYTFM